MFNASSGIVARKGKKRICLPNCEQLETTVYRLYSVYFYVVHPLGGFEWVDETTVSEIFPTRLTFAVHLGADRAMRERCMLRFGLQQQWCVAVKMHPVTPVHAHNNSDGYCQCYICKAQVS